MNTTETTTTNATAATQAVSPRPNYRIYDRTGGGVTEDIYAETLEDAIERGKDWIEDGDWSGGENEDGERVYRTVKLDCAVGEIVWVPNLSSIEALPGVYSAEVVDGVIHAIIDPTAHDGLAAALDARLARVEPAPTDEADEMRVAVCLASPLPMMIDEDATLDGQWHDCSGQYTPDMPECEVNLPSEPPYESTDGTVTEWESDADDQGHIWRTPSSLLGEFSSHSHGGTAMPHSSVCALCGKYRTERNPGSQRNPNEALSIITIKDRDEKSEAWLKETHEEDGYLPAWLVEMLDCSVSTRMTKDQAREYIAEHTDEDDLDDDDLEHAFAATFGRRADDKDRAEGLWSHLCAATV